MSGEYGGCGALSIAFRSIKSNAISAVCGGALSEWTTSSLFSDVFLGIVRMPHFDDPIF
jgi:hypothetical protein